LCVVFLRGVGIVGEAPAKVPAHPNQEDDISVHASDDLKAENYSLSSIIRK
jgi:hypothetical protein